VAYTLRAEPEGPDIPLPGATWADWDQRGRLIVARAGQLVHWAGPDSQKLIADFNPQTPKS
jgi:hypothetical protein